MFDYFWNGQEKKASQRFFWTGLFKDQLWVAANEFRILLNEVLFS